MKKVAVCGIAIPSVVKMVVGSAKMVLSWLMMEPASMLKMNTATTCTVRQARVEEEVLRRDGCEKVGWLGW